MSNRHLKVLILCPTGQDANLVSAELAKDDLDSVIVNTIEDLCNDTYENAGTLLIAEEALNTEAIELLNRRLLAQEPWSDIPIILLTSGGPKRNQFRLKRLELFIASGNVTLLERPLQSITLISANHVALRSRRRQFQVKDLLQAQREATKMRDEFISIAGHELKTPLTSMKLQSQLTKRRLESDFANFHPEKMISFINHTNNQINRLNKLVEDMLDISRISTGKVVLQKTPLNVSDLLTEMIDRFQPQFEIVGINVNTSIDPNVTAQLDNFKIEQVINNLFSNVIRYSPHKPVEVNLKKKHNHIFLNVRDHGMGIAPENMARIFERFERASSASSGLGLGLYITKQIIELHQGSIRVESELGKGANFIIELPA